MKNKKSCKEQIKLIKKIARNEFLEYNMLTKTTKDKTIYNRKVKHPKKQD